MGTERQLYVGEVAKLIGVSPSRIRMWENDGLLTVRAPQRNPVGTEIFAWGRASWGMLPGGLKVPRRAAAIADRLARDQSGRDVSLDIAIETMRQSGNDMSDRYRETSTGGLAVNVVEC
jgi:hypothetical protein